jgi:hypothetical protein
LKTVCVYFVGVHCEEMRMRKTLAILATVATVGATAVTAPAPAEARGIGPGLAFGMAAGAHSPPALRPARTVRTVIMDQATATALVITGRPITAMSLTPTTAVPIIIGTTTGAITGNEKARNIVSGLFCFA